MKKYALSIIFVFISFCIKAQKMNVSEIPFAITKNFNIKFPSVLKVKWIKTESLYFARFMIYGKGAEATYETNGNLVETMTEISVKELPAEVISGINNIFVNAKIKTVAKIEMSTNEILYVIQLRYKGKNKEVTIDTKGNMV